VVAVVVVVVELWNRKDLKLVLLVWVEYLES
jgi:hypothetical protein